MDPVLSSLVQSVRGYNPVVDERLLERAYDFADRAHRGQKRLSGEPYFSHCVAVAQLLAELELDTTTVAAGLLHDVVEDTDCPISTVKEEFGDEIALLVEGVTKIGALSFKSLLNNSAVHPQKVCAKVLRVQHQIHNDKWVV